MALAMEQWPAPQPGGVRPGVVANERPERPGLVPVFCQTGLTEMSWSTFRRNVRDPSRNPLDPAAFRPGPWEGEFQCDADGCSGTHTARPGPVHVPSLWRRVPAPRSAQPLCQCQRSTMQPVLLHAPDNRWHAAWQCFACGIHLHATAEQAVDVSAWLLAAERLGPEQWEAAAAADTSAGFWAAVRDRASEIVRESGSGRGQDYDNASPPASLTARTNSQIFVPLLLDAAGHLSQAAQLAWRQHELASVDWDRWTQELRAAPSVPLATMVADLQACMRAHPGADPMNRDVCLLWQSAMRWGGSDALTSLVEMVRVSRTRSGYCPGLVQEVLLKFYGGPQLAQAVTLLAAAMRARSARADVGPAEDATSAAPRECGGAQATARLGGFVRGADLVTGHGWNRAAAAASEICDRPMSGPGSSAPHFSIADADDAFDSTGLTQEVAGMVVDGTAAPLQDADRAVGGRRVRRRRGDNDPSQLLRCTMCQSADAFQARDSRGLMQHIVRAHLGQPLLAETIAQLRALGKEACRVCASIRARSTPHCNSCGCATPTRPLQLGDIVPDRRRGGSQGDHDMSHPSSQGRANVAAPASSDDSAGHASVAAVAREASVSEAAKEMAKGLRRHALFELPVSVAARMGVCLAESLESCMAGDETWGFLAQHRSRLLLAHVPRGTDRVSELKRRLRLWEQGLFDELIQHVVAQQLEENRQGPARTELQGDEHKGAKARQQTAAGAKSKAVKGLVGGIATGSPEQRASWTTELIPRSETSAGPFARPDEHDAAKQCAWGQGDLREAKKEMQTAGRRPDSPPGIPWAKLSPWSAAGPTGDRQEHLEAMQRASSPAQRRRLNRALDELAVRWAINMLPASCRWLLNTLVVFLRKSRTPTSKAFDDEEWLRAVQEPGWEQDIPEEDIEAVGPEVEGGEDVSMESVDEANGQVSVRPIQIGEFLRRLTSKRLMLLQKADRGRVMYAMRQIGVGTPGGAEALAILHQLLHDIWSAGELPSALARIKVDERNCYGRLEWSAIRAAIQQALPRHLAATCWKHESASHVEQEGVAPAPKDRGAEQGDVDGAVECSVTLGGVAADARSAVHAMQRRGELPWTAPSLEAVDDFDRREARVAAWKALEPSQRRETGATQRIVANPAHEIQAGGGLLDVWFLDDGDILCDPRLVQPYLACFDSENPKVGGDRNIHKTEVIYYASEAQMQALAEEWRLEEVRALATVRTASDPGLTLGVAVGPTDKIEAQLQQKVQVIRAMQERVAIAHDVQTEHVLSSESLGVGRVNHILRVHGDHIARDNEALAGFDASTRAEMDRLFPHLTDESREQASLSVAVGGLGWRRATDIARAANLSALVMARPFVRSMAAAAVRAGLMSEGVLEDRLDTKIQEVQAGYLGTLDEADRVKAAEFVQKARDAAERNWEHVADGASVAAEAPSVDVSFEEGDVAPAASGHIQDEDVERAGGARRRLTTQHLQRELGRLLDRTRLRALEATLRRQCNWDQVEALKDLRHEKVSHKWIRHLDSRRGAVLSQMDYIFSVQRRLGARIQEREIECRLCGAPLDPSLAHADCCDPAGATRGHYAVVRELVRGLKLADPTTTTEPRGLTTTQSRPADILTYAAVPGRSAALDVCVASPNASSAAGDAAESAFKRKLRRYRREIPELAAAGIVFRPMVWTTNGRPHPAVTRTLHFAAEQAANRSEQATPRAILGRWCHEIQIALLRRRAAMARAVLPQLSKGDAWMLTGYSGAVPASDRRAAPLAGHAEIQADNDDDEDLDSTSSEGEVDNLSEASGD